MSRKLDIQRRTLAGAKESLNSAIKMLSRTSYDFSAENLQEVRSAANQARQAAHDLDMLSGMFLIESQQEK